MNNANTWFNAGLGRESSTALASALEKRSRRDVCACVPYSLLGELGEDEITNRGGSPGRALPSNENKMSCRERERARVQIARWNSRKAG
jgi:hypothetical protein